MCTVVILRRPEHRWPLLLAANRDEMAGRPWRTPGRHWADRPEVTAGLDELAGGSWLGINDHGVVAAALNRRHSLGPAAGKRSRGELVLEALDHADAASAAEALCHLEPLSYRTFNLVVADNRAAYWLAWRGEPQARRIDVAEIGAGLHMLTAHDLDDPASPRIRVHRPRFAAAPAPAPEANGGAGDWLAWETLLASPGSGRDGEEQDAMAIKGNGGFGTVSSALVALPAPNTMRLTPRFRFAAGLPGLAAFEEISV